MQRISVKKTIVMILVILLLSLSLCLGTCKVVSIRYIELGIPSSFNYSNGISARCPWDLIIWEDKLFVGSGDYDVNAGPIDIWYYDISQKAWMNSGTVPDEEINRFVVMDDFLIAPGIDPQEDCTLGNLYYFKNDSWSIVRNIPGGMHCFDVVNYNGNIFVGLGVEPGKYPIAVSLDNGKSFTPVVMKKNGVSVDTSRSNNVRVYDLFVFNETLYAIFLYGDTEITYDLYKYYKGEFVFDNELYNKIHQVKYNNYIIGGKAEFKGNMYFTTGYLYVTNDMTNFTRIDFPNEKTVYDICIYKNNLYVLCGERLSNGRCEVSIWKNHNNDAAKFEEFFRFVYDISPLSMACNQEGFYIGMGERSSINDKNGMILYIKYSMKKEN